MTSIKKLPAYKVKEMLDELGYLDGFTVEETNKKYPAPIVQMGYPRETAKNVKDSNAIIAIQQLGANGPQPYYHDININLHLWTPVNSSQNFISYMARMNEIMIGLRESWRNQEADVQLISTDFMEGGETKSGRSIYYAQIRVVCEL